jgi:hypothetical protein
MRGTWGTRPFQLFPVPLAQFPVPFSLFSVDFSVLLLPCCVFQHQVDDLRLANVQARLRLEELAHLDAIELFVALGARTPDRRSARGVQEAELNAYGIGDLAHDAAQRIDFADQMSLCHSANGWVTAHLSDKVEVHCDESGFQAHACSCHGGLAPGVSCADHCDVVLFGEGHPNLILRMLWGLGYRVSGIGHWVSGTGYRVLGAGSRRLPSFEAKNGSFG